MIAVREVGRQRPLIVGVLNMKRSGFEMKLCQLGWHDKLTYIFIHFVVGE